MPTPKRRTPPLAPASIPALEDYAHRGRECAYGNLRMVTRVIGTLYDDALRPVDLHAGQLSLLWAILATEPVEPGRLAAITLTDPTTLSRTVAKLHKARLVSVRPGSDGRRKEIRLTAQGRARFAAAMPHWEKAQQRVAEWLAMADIRALARKVRNAAKEAA